MCIKKQAYGQTNEKKIYLYTLTNTNGLKAEIINFGGIVTRLYVPDRNGNFADIVLGYDTLEEYISDGTHFGALIGRYGNRIAKGKFSLNGVEYTLAQNNGENHLHGGIKGFNKVVWDAEEKKIDNSIALKLTYLSKDGEEGYPGNLTCTVIYTLTNDNELKISYEAKTDKTTVVNLTNHSYFNLAGHDSGNVLAHEIMLNADHFLPVDDGLIPTGQIKPVKGTPMDFTKPMTIGSRITQVKGGYDHNYCLNSSDGSPAPAVEVYEPGSGRVMQIFTTQPGVQFYTGNFLSSSNKGKGAVYNKHNGFCLETQHFPDSPNKPDFPSVVLKPGQKYKQLTVHKFSVK
ncbi:MAG: aldose epimerase family protein [Planctomycetota bacterium]|jgi:aldose 1-epimerase